MFHIRILYSGTKGFIDSVLSSRVPLTGEYLRLNDDSYRVMSVSTLGGTPQYREGRKYTHEIEVEASRKLEND